MGIPAELTRLLKEAKGITSDSREVKEGYIFFALKGTRFDGHHFLEEAVRRKALALVVEREVNTEGVKVIKVEDTKKALAESAHLYFGKPSESLEIVGVTGTNGKTTTTYILESILKKAGKKVGLMGTIHYRLEEKVFGSGRTTPDPITWHRTLKDMLGEGASHVVCEVSSHALDQHRVWGTRFEAVMFTNLTQDHLDYHRNMEEYFRAKARLFFDYKYRFAVVNTDDEYGKRLAKELGKKALSYGREGDLRILDFKTSFDGSALRLSFGGREYEFRSNLIGDFQAYNLSAAIAYALREGIEPDIIQEAVRELYVPGRFEVHRSERGFIAIVDYAHTPDAVDNVLRTLRKLTRGKVISVLGAGGNRDRGKRPLMGEAAQRWSDIVVLTSDNPRDEEPMAIIEDMLKGVKRGEGVVVEVDRREAIKKAVSMAREGDAVAVLGKGHEDYQEIKGVKYPFSDSEVLREFL